MRGSRIIRGRGGGAGAVAVAVVVAWVRLVKWNAFTSVAVPLGPIVPVVPGATPTGCNGPVTATPAVATDVATDAGGRGNCSPSGGGGGDTTTLLPEDIVVCLEASVTAL